MNVLDVGACDEDWQCSWTECNEQNYSIAVNCTDANSCGTNAEKPVSVPCYLDPLTGKLMPGITKSGSACASEFNCTEWSACDVSYTSEDVLQGRTLTEGRQSRICTDSSACQLPKIEYQPCTFNIPISAQSVEWCNSTYVELIDLEKNMTVSRIKESAVRNITRLDIKIMATNFTGYCDYCYNKIKDYDEELVDCGGPNCPACIEVPLKAGMLDFVIVLLKWVLWLLLLLLIAILANSMRKEHMKKGTKEHFIDFEAQKHSEIKNKEHISKKKTKRHFHATHL